MYNCRTEHREMLSSSSVVDGSEVGGAAGVSRSEPVMSSGRDDGGPVNPSPSSTDAGSLSTLAMIILSYNKNDVRLAIDNVRKGMPRQYFFQHVLCNVIKPNTSICLSIFTAYLIAFVINQSFNQSLLRQKAAHAETHNKMLRREENNCTKTNTNYKLN